MARSKQLSQVVLYLDNTFSTEMPGLVIERAVATPCWDVTESPVETGMTAFDNMVRRPMTFQVSGYFDNVSERTASAALAKVYRKQRERDPRGNGADGLFFSMRTKDNLYSNLILTSMPDSQDGEKMTLSQVSFEFKEALLVQGLRGSGTGGGEDSNFVR